MSSIHDQVRRTVMAHCFKRLRELPDDDVTLILNFYGHVRAAAAKVKEARQGNSGRKPTTEANGEGGPLKSVSITERPSSNSHMVLLSSLDDQRSVTACDDSASRRPLDMPPSDSLNASCSFFSTLPSSSSYSNENSNASQPLPAKDARSVKISALAGELRRMGDLVYGLQLGVLHLNDLCVIGHILNMKRATEYIHDTIADLEADQGIPPMTEESSGKQITSPIETRQSSTKKRRRPLSKNVMVAELDDYHRTQEPLKKERRSAVASEILVPSTLAVKPKVQPRTRGGVGNADESEVSPANEKRAVTISEETVISAQSREAENVSSPKDKKLRSEKMRVSAKTESGSLSSSVPLRTATQITTGLTVLKKVLPMGSSSLANNHPPPLMPSHPQQQSQGYAMYEQVPSRSSGGISLLASLGVCAPGGASPPQQKKFAISANDFEEETGLGQNLMGSSGASRAVLSANTVHGQALTADEGNYDDDEGEEYEEIEEIEEVEEIIEEDDEDVEDSGSTENAELNVVSGSVFKTVNGPSAPKAALYDFSTDVHQRDAADFLLKQVVLQGTLSTTKGAELLIKKRIPFVPIDPSTGQGAVGVECAPQTATSTAERFVNCVFKQFHKQEKVAYDHGVAYIY